MTGLSVTPVEDRSKPEPPAETVQERPHQSEASEPVTEATPESEALAGDWEPGGGEAVEEPSPGPALTPEIVREAGIKASRVHGKPAIRAIFQELGISGFTSMLPEQYPEFMRKLGELNAK
ncbi:hypothetical protein [Solibaculum mannosilyticum]|nr:hypothetical protein [Solibaculum mannosilyticum]